MHNDRSALSAYLILGLPPPLHRRLQCRLAYVGGSILNHDHFKVVRARFPLMKADVSETFGFPNIPDVKEKSSRGRFS